MRSARSVATPLAWAEAPRWLTTQAGRVVAKATARASMRAAGTPLMPSAQSGVYSSRWRARAATLSATLAEGLSVTRQ